MNETPNIEPLITYNQLAFAMEAFLLGLAVFIVGCYTYEYVIPFFRKWIRNLFILESEQVPEWDFETEPISHVRIIENPIANTTNKPYDWAQEEDNDYTG